MHYLELFDVLKLDTFSLPDLHGAYGRQVCLNTATG